MADDRATLQKQLQWYWVVAIGVGAIALVIALVWIQSPGGPGLDFIWGVAAFGLAAIVYNVAFFILCSIFAPWLSDMVEDDTEVSGDDVVHVVKHTETGDEAIDSYVRTYAAARGATAVAIVSGVMVAIALMFF